MKQSSDASTPSNCRATDDDESRWLAHASDLASRYSTEVYGDDTDPYSRQLDQIFVRCAAIELWESRSVVDSQPCWGALDVARWLDRMRRWPLWSEMRENAIMAMLAFYTFLIKHRHVPREHARRTVTDLEALAAPIVQGMMMSFSGRGAAMG